MNRDTENKHFEDLISTLLRYSNNYMGLANVFNVKISTVCLEKRSPPLGHRELFLFLPLIDGGLNGPKLKIRETFTAASNGSLLFEFRK